MTHTTARRDGAESVEVGEHLPDARRELRQERHVLRTEVEAFGQFHKHLRAVETVADPPGSPTPQSAAASLATRDADQPGSAAAPVRAAYVETVMDTPHYDSEYGDTFWESVAAEFGGEVAMALRQSTRLTPLLKDRLLDAVREAVSSREQLLSSLTREADALDEAETVIGDVREELVAIRSRPFYDCSARELRQLLADLDALDADCQDLAVRRQSGDLDPETVHVPAADSRPLNEYLYQPLATSYPVLHAVGRASDCVVTTARRIRRVLPAVTASAEIGG